LKPDVVRKELDEADAVLGDPDAVRDFVLSAAQRIGLSITPDKRASVFRVPTGETARVALPEAIRFVLPVTKTGQWLVSFVSPEPEDTEYLGRNHRFVAALAGFLMEQALTAGAGAAAARCGVIRTRAVERLTTIVLLRVRYLIEVPERPPQLAEEVLAIGYSDGPRGGRSWLGDDEALRLLTDAKPDANLPSAEKRDLIAAALHRWPELAEDLRKRVTARGNELERSHKRVRQAVAIKVRELTVAPQFPPDVLGILVLQPIV
jgi:hypothetical protein